MSIVAIVGRPNVGKSTLFNKLVGYKKAITTDEPGVTLDLNYGEVKEGDFFFTLVDTGGFEPDVKPVPAEPAPHLMRGGKQGEEISFRVREQVEVAVDEADLIICIMDGRSGLIWSDRDIVDMLRGADKPVIYVVNKIDTPKHESLLLDFLKLGIEPIIPISAEHGIGIGDLLDEIKERLPSLLEERIEREETRVAIVGRPNVGKSTLVNRILGFERVIVSSVPGTTRDVVDTVFKRDGKYYRLMDTAGIRRKSRIERQLERYSVMSAIRGIEGCDTAVLMIDAQEGVTSQDARIGGLISSKGKGCIIAVNKWDMVTKDTHTMTAYERKIMEELYFLKFAPVLFISAKIGKRVERLFPLIDSIAEGLKTKIPTSRLNRVLEEKKKGLGLPSWRGKEVKIYYMTQVGINPPTFVVFVNHPEAFKEAQKRFLVDTLREGLGLKHIPIRLHIRRRE